MKTTYIFVAACAIASAVGAPAAADPITPRTLVEIRDISHLSISPDGKVAVFRVSHPSIERNLIETAWYAKALGTDQPPIRIADGGNAILTDAGVPINEQPVWLPDGRFVFYRARFDGAIQVWAARVDGAQTYQVTYDAADVDTFNLSADGERVEYTVRASRALIRETEQSEYDQGVHIDGTTPMGVPLFRYRAYDNGLAYSHRFTGLWMSKMPMMGNYPLTRKSVDWRGKSGDQPLVLGAQDLSVASSTPDGAKLYLKREGGAVALVPTDPAKALIVNIAGNIKTCGVEACRSGRVVSLRWGRDPSEIVFLSTRPQAVPQHSLMVWNYATGAVRTLVSTSGTLSGDDNETAGEGCSVGIASVVCVQATPNQAPQVISVGLKTGKSEPLFAPNDNIRFAADQQAEHLEWVDARSQTYSGVYFAPAGPKPEGGFPLFIQYYRCKGFVRGGTGDEWPFRTLAEAGIAVLCINAAPPHTNDVRLDYEDGVEGVRAGIAMLDKRIGVNRRKVGMGGLSFGSEVALWIAMKTDLVAAVSLSSPSVTPIYYWLNVGHSGDYKARLKRKWQLVEPTATDPRWKDMSPAYQTDRISSAVLFQMPEEEYLNVVEYFSPMKARKQADMYVFPQAPHLKWMPRQKLAVYERNLDWFRFWLQDYVNPDPRKKAQYTLWREMRTARAEWPASDTLRQP